MKWISKWIGGSRPSTPEAGAETPAGTEAPTTWRCIACNAVNEDSGKFCGNCSRPRPWDPTPAYVYQNSATGIRPAPPPANTVPWTCPQCGHENARANNFCIMCQEKRPPLPRP